MLRGLSALRPVTVARTMLMGFVVPSHLVRMSRTPASSRTARTPPAGDDAGTGRGRLEQDTRRSELAQDLVRDGRLVHRHAEQVLLCVLDGLLDGKRHLVGLAVPSAHRAVLVAHHYEGGEREAPAALDHLGHAVDVDHALLELVRILLILPLASLSPLEDQAALAGTLGQSLYSAVIQIAGPIETTTVDAGCLGALREQRADQLGHGSLVLAGRPFDLS